MTVPPARPRQRTLALKEANRVRHDRKQIKQQVRRGEFDKVITNPPDSISSMLIFDLLLCVPRYGHVKALRLLNRVRVSATRRVGDLTIRERAEIRKMIAG